MNKMSSTVDVIFNPFSAVAFNRCFVQTPKIFLILVFIQHNNQTVIKSVSA